MTPARLTVITHIVALAIGIGLGACGSTVRLSGYGVTLEIEPTVQAKLEGLTPEERHAVLVRGLYCTTCPDPGEKDDDTTREGAPTSTP